MTYRQAQAILEANKLASNITIIEKMVYQGLEAHNRYSNNFRNWDDEITAEDMARIERCYCFCKEIFL